MCVWDAEPGPESGPAGGNGGVGGGGGGGGQAYASVSSFSAEPAPWTRARPGDYLRARVTGASGKTLFVQPLGLVDVAHSF